MGRNVGEAAFGGNVRVLDHKGRLLPAGERFGSTILVPEIYCLETMLESLQPPQWPEQWGRNEKLFARGRNLFDMTCAEGCHRPKACQDTCDPKRRIAEGAPSKEIEWKIESPDVHTDGSSLAAQISARYDLSAVVPGAVAVSAIEGLNKVIPAVVDFQYDRLGLDPKTRNRFNGFGAIPGARAPQGYHARPLHGIWATPPFLHNGSVRSLYELLLPEDQRAKRFWIGPSQEYDLQKLGFAAEQGPGSVELDTTRPGNGNMGHPYGTTLSERDRLALLEYLKFLGRAREFNEADPDERPPEPGDLKKRLAEACHRGLQGPAGAPSP
jgi:hypothetical protein